MPCSSPSMKTLSNDNYYYIMRECLLGIERRILNVVLRSDQKYLNFIRNSKAFLDAWEAIIPTPKISHAREFTERDIRIDECTCWITGKNKNI